MKYINPYYPWFTSMGATVYYSGSKDGCFSLENSAWSIVNVDQDTITGTHMKMVFDIKIKSSYTSAYLAGFKYCDVNGTATPNAFIYLSKQYLSISVNDKIVLSSQAMLPINEWKHVLFDVDNTKGIILIYIDGKKIAEYQQYVKTEAAVRIFQIYTDSTYIIVKNIIVTDGELSPNETVMEVDYTVESSEWDKSQDDGYATENVGKCIVLKPDKTKIDGYKITGVGMLWESAIGSDNVPAINASVGGKNERIQLPSINRQVAGTCFDKVDSLENIVITSAE